MQNIRSTIFSLPQRLQQNQTQDHIPGFERAQKELNKMIQKDESENRLKLSLRNTTKSLAGKSTIESTHIFGTVVDNLSKDFALRIQIHSDVRYPAATTLMGNNYIFHNANAPEKTTVLDSSYIKFKNDGSLTVAVSDGAGHPYDEISTQNILTVSRNATKYAARLLAKFDSAEEILQSVPGIVKTLDSFLRDLTRNGGEEQTTLASARLFPTQDGYRIVGFSVGDSSIGYVNQTTGQFTQLTSEGRIGDVAYQLGRVPQGDINPDQICVIDAIIPHGNLLYLATDGVSDALNMKTLQIAPPQNSQEVINSISEKLKEHFNQTVQTFEQLSSERRDAQSTYVQAFRIIATDKNNPIPEDDIKSLKDSDTPLLKSLGEQAERFEQLKQQILNKGALLDLQAEDIVQLKNDPSIFLKSS